MSAGVDPQVMQDVIEATFTVPGRGVIRGLRVTEFARQNGIQKCGGKAGPSDSTANRPDQSMFPDLELIRERGFAENGSSLEEDKQLQELPRDCNLLPDVPRAEDWHNLSASWAREVASPALADASLSSLKGPMAQCLTDRVGKEIDPVDPASSFLRTADVTMLSTDDWETGGEARYAAAYADCGKDYFAKYGELLLAKRPAQVERNRELLNEFAAGLVKAGYVP
ncbi:MAG: hypothetical protein QM619_06065 [Micropruina sp.]|uniref:hypothetical protein n=1 Tax=Micropruina sp. TaxID=2737536 RepID=UPI0039E64DC2